MTIDANLAIGILGFLAQLVCGVIWISRLGAKVEQLEEQVKSCRSDWQESNDDQRQHLHAATGRFANVEDTLHKMALTQAVTAEQMKTVGEKLERIDKSMHMLSGQVLGRSAAKTNGCAS